MNLLPHDEKYMLRCIELSQQSLDSGDAAFGSLITIDEQKMNTAPVFLNMPKLWYWIKHIKL